MSDRYRNRSRSRQKDKYRQRQRERQRSRSPKNRQSSKYNSSKQPSYNKQSRQTKPKQFRRQEEKPQEQTKVLCIEDLPSNIGSELQRKMTDTSITVGTSLPDEVEIKDNLALIKYPSVQVSSGIFNNLKGSVTLSNRQYKLKYWPIKKSQINILYDWYCDKCDYKNFARRGKCHRCDNQKNPNCKLNYGNQFVSIGESKREQIDDSVNCSLMIRGPIIMEVQQEILLNIFESFAPVKDIRMIRNKITGGNKDFAFVEYFTPEQAAMALKKANYPDFKIGGQKVTVMYSKTKQDDDFFSRPYDKDRRGAPPRRQTKISDDMPNYYLRQRQLQIEEQKKRPLITLEQLKEKRQSQLKKAIPQQQKEMSEQQNQRRKAELMAKQWQKEMKMQTVQIFICPLCKRKFKNEEEMNDHSKYSQLHKYKLRKVQNQLLAL